MKKILTVLLVMMISMTFAFAAITGAGSSDTTAAASAETTLTLDVSNKLSAVRVGFSATQPSGIDTEGDKINAHIPAPALAELALTEYAPTTAKASTKTPNYLYFRVRHNAAVTLKLSGTSFTSDTITGMEQKIDYTVTVSGTGEGTMTPASPWTRSLSPVNGFIGGFNTFTIETDAIPADYAANDWKASLTLAVIV